VHDNGTFRLAQSQSTIATALKGAGYDTGAFVGAFVLDARFGLNHGFDVYDDRMEGTSANLEVVQRPAEQVLASAERWITMQHPAPGTQHPAPFFAWIHLYDPHAPYDPPPPYDTRFKDPYDGEIAYADASLGKLFQYLRQRGLYDRSLIVIMSDHGESLGAHGESMHGIFLYDETIHVPLLFKLPGSLLAGKRVTTRVRLVDVAPTLLSMLSLPQPPTFQGQSLVPEMKSSPKAAADLPAYAETEYPHRAFGWAGIRAMRSGKYLYIRAPKRELYDQTVDKTAEHNLAASSPAVTDTLGSQLDKFYDETTSFHGKPQQNTTTSEQSENLAALGYVSSSAAGQSQDPLQGADPKDKIEISNILHEGMIAVEDGRYNEAIPMLQHVLADSPAITAAQLQLGVALARTKRYSEAIPALKKAIELVPDAVQAKYELGLALYETGAWNDSVPYFEDVAKKRPKWVDAQYSLASVYARTKRVPEAVEILNRVLEISPDHFRANLLLGRILYLQGDPAAALPHLEKAVQVAPNSGEAHSFLADAYGQLERHADATRERGKARSLSH